MSQSSNINSLTTDAELRSILVGIYDQLTQIRDAIDPDHALLRRVYPLLAGILTDRTFISAEVFEHSRLPGQEPLARALATTNARKFGGVLMRKQGVPIEGWTVQAVGIEGRARVFVLKPVK